MIAVRALRAELRKATALPAVWAGIAVALAGSLAITLLNSVTARGAIRAGEAEEMLADTSPYEAGFAAAPLGTVGAVIIGVVIISSEYTANSPDAGGSRQITTTLAAVPQRAVILLAKVLTTSGLVGLTALVTLPACLAVAHLVMGGLGEETVTVSEGAARWLGAWVYWTLMGMMALAITVLTRSGIIPLIVLILNNSLVSFSFLLTLITPVAFWLPDMAGRKLFGGPDMAPGGLDLAPGALVMLLWTLALLAIAGVTFQRRDA